MVLLAVVLALGILIFGAWAVEYTFKKMLNEVDEKVKHFEEQLKEKNEKV